MKRISIKVDFEVPDEERDGMPSLQWAMYEVTKALDEAGCKVYEIQATLE